MWHQLLHPHNSSGSGSHAASCAQQLDWRWLNELPKRNGVPKGRCKWLMAGPKHRLPCFCSELDILRHCPTTHLEPPDALRCRDRKPPPDHAENCLPTTPSSKVHCKHVQGCKASSLRYVCTEQVLGYEVTVTWSLMSNMDQHPAMHACGACINAIRDCGSCLFCMQASVAAWNSPSMSCCRPPEWQRSRMPLPRTSSSNRPCVASFFCCMSIHETVASAMQCMHILALLPDDQVLLFLIRTGTGSRIRSAAWTSTPASSACSCSGASATLIMLICCDGMSIAAPEPATAHHVVQKRSYKVPQASSPAAS